MFIVFSLSLLLVGFYGYAFMNGDSCTSDAECDSGHCGPYGDFIPDGRSNICVECLADTDCSGVACDTTIGQCMITLPSANTVLPQPRPILVCGNGVLEQGEQCAAASRLAIAYMSRWKCRAPPSYGRSILMPEAPTAR